LIEKYYTFIYVIRYVWICFRTNFYKYTYNIDRKILHICLSFKYIYIVIWILFSKHCFFRVYSQNFESNAERSNRKCKTKHTHSQLRCLWHVFSGSPVGKWNRKQTHFPFGESGKNSMGENYVQLQIYAHTYIYANSNKIEAQTSCKFSFFATHHHILEWIESLENEMKLMLSMHLEFFKLEEKKNMKK